MAIPFYNHKNFCGERARISAATCLKESIHLFPQTLTPEQKMRKHDILAYFDHISLEHMGVLRGEYILLPNGVALLDKNGQFITIGTTADDLSSQQINTHLNTLDVTSRNEFLAHWDTMPTAHHVAVASDRYPNNYWHLSMEFIPRFRFFDRYDVDCVAIPHNLVRTSFQKDLIIKAVGTKKIIVVSHPIKVVDPVLVFSRMSTEGILWLRRIMNIPVQSGPKRYYIRRGSSITRKRADGGDANRGGLVEDAPFLEFLNRFGFQTVEFGSGEHSIETQVNMLQGAHIILASHGAHLTNSLYLQPPLTLLEILGPNISSAAYLYIANALSFGYYGLVSDQMNEVGDLVVDCERLQGIMEEILAP